MKVAKGQSLVFCIFFLILFAPLHAWAAPVATPVFRLAPGTYNFVQMVTISCATSGATIRYTIDGGGPTSSSTIYTRPIIVTATTTIQAEAFKDGMTNSAVAVATYTIVLKVAAPVFMPWPGTYNSVLNVTIWCATPGATIRYTTNGNDPTSSSTSYTNPIIVTATTTIKAETFKDGMTASDVSTASYTIVTKVATPVFRPGQGTYNSALNVAITCETAGATIHYTTDKTEPSLSSTIYTGPIDVTSTTTINAKAFMSGWAESAKSTATYTIVPKVAATMFSPGSGIYYSVLKVAITCATDGATIRYTTDRSEPNSTSTAYSGPINVATTTTIRARAFKIGWAESAVSTAIYTIVLQVATPVFRPESGTYSSTQSVAIFCGTPGAAIHYTTNGDEPAAKSTAYTGPISVASTTTIKAKAFRTGLTDSAMATATYTIVPQVATPVFKPGSGIYNSAQSVTISCETVGATIYYTTNVSAATSSWTVYSKPLTVSSSSTIKAMASKSGMANSAVGTAMYFISAKAVLLMGAMSSDLNSWNDFLADYGYDARTSDAPSLVAPIIYAGDVVGHETAVPDRKGVYYYRLEFGAYDQSTGRTGLQREGISIVNRGNIGDVDSLDAMAMEVREAVACILSRHENAQVLLVGHSIGGLAARAFLQTQEGSLEKSAVAALVTTGTPHGGTPLGSIYGYLADNASNLAPSAGRGAVDYLRGLELRQSSDPDLSGSAVIDFSPDSAVIARLASDASRLPASVQYGTQSYDGVRLGSLTLSYNVFDGFGIAATGGRSLLTTMAGAGILGDISDGRFMGDGMVPASSQTFASPQITILRRSNSSGTVLHANEPAQKVDLRALIEALVDWWK